MEITSGTRAFIAVTAMLMLVAAGMVGYGLGYERGSWDSTPRSAINASGR